MARRSWSNARGTACAAFGAVLLVACVSHRPALTPAADGAAPTRALVDTLAAHIAAAEVRLLAVRADMTDDAPDVREAAARVAALRAALEADAPGRAAAQAVSRRVLETLDARRAALAVARRELLVRLTAADPLVRRNAEEERLVAGRRAAVRAEASGR